MNRKSRVLLSIVLVLLALVPWAETIFNLVNQALTGTAPPLPYQSIEDLENTGWSWEVYWHIVILLVFWAILFLKSSIPMRSKIAWAVGLFFLWPIVSVVFVVKEIWLDRARPVEA